MAEPSGLLPSNGRSFKADPAHSKGGKCSKQSRLVGWKDCMRYDYHCDVRQARVVFSRGTLPSTLLPPIPASPSLPPSSTFPTSLHPRLPNSVPGRLPLLDHFLLPSGRRPVLGPRRLLVREPVVAAPRRLAAQADCLPPALPLPPPPREDARAAPAPRRPPAGNGRAKGQWPPSALLRGLWVDAAPWKDATLSCSRSVVSESSCHLSMAHGTALPGDIF